jgi:hypothetical protein
MQTTCNGERHQSSVATKRRRAILEQRLPFEYIGLTVQAARSLAEKQGREFRIGQEDGEAYPISANASDGRITARVNGGIVSSISVERLRN